MSTLRIGTFNIENLFLRYRLLENEKAGFKKTPIDPNKFVTEGGSILMLGLSIDEYGPIAKSARRLTAQTILENDPDVLAVQEIENMQALEIFNRTWLERAFPYFIAVEGNDPRQIDVGLLSKHPIGVVRTHRFDQVEETPQRIFSRDCLEVDIEMPGAAPVTILVNHFKSKIGGGEEQRLRQATRVAGILRQRFGSKLDQGHFVVAGDLNDGAAAAPLKPLMSLGLENVVDRLPKKDRWTHYYKKGKSAEQLDYLLLSPSLAKSGRPKAPHVERRGLGSDIDYYDGPRFDNRVSGGDGASDHCPVFIDVEV